MRKLKGLLLLLISVMVLNGCQTPTDTSTPTHTELEVRNNSGNVDFWFVNSISVGEKQFYYYESSNYEIRHGDKGIFTFTEDDVNGDLTDISVGIRLQYHDENVQRESVSLNLDFILGERRVIRVDCESLYNNERCRTDGLVLTIVE